MMDSSIRKPSSQPHKCSSCVEGVTSISCTKWRLLQGALFVIVVIVAAVWTHQAIVIFLLIFTALGFAIFQYYHDQQQQTKTAIDNARPDWARNSKTTYVPGELPESNKELLTAFMKDQEHYHPENEGMEESAMFESTLNFDFSSKEPIHPDIDALFSNLSPSNKPIADLFPDASISLADISGFTAFSSSREPAHSFRLLEALYQTFDKVAQRKRIFKVETIGDCYVSVCGLPERRPDHAVALCNYALSCMRKFEYLIPMLEEKFGPLELSLRIGVHSGPILAGLLRAGSDVRFQVFGETVSIASTIENTGRGGKIHISKETAVHMTKAGKGHWLQKRDDKIDTSKGEIQTFWLLDQQSRGASKVPSSLMQLHSTVSEDSLSDDNGWETLGGSEHTRSHISPGGEAKTRATRLVGWICEIMLPLLKMIVARRNAEKKKKVLIENESGVRRLEAEIGSTLTVLEEVEEVISLPRYDAKVQRNTKSNSENIELGEDVEAQLREFVSVIASLYYNNPFHNFEHACHVTLSASKLLSRIVTPEEITAKKSGGESMDVASDLHDFSYGINSDPLTQFSLIMAALIHDVDHRGIPNSTLCQEDREMSAVYNFKAVAEQNSVDLAWEALMDSRFSSLRKSIYGESEAELKRFRILLVNCVMSTEMFDDQLKQLRNARWEKAFSVPDGDQPSIQAIDRKATIVLEHLIQASDVSHSMQHWHVYQKFNEKLFHEMYLSYRMGRTENDPSKGWYKGEIGFFDFYVIPLAKKLKECGVFGVSSDEMLNFAVSNREEWVEKGQQISRRMAEKYSFMMDAYDTKSNQAGRQPAQAN